MEHYLKILGHEVIDKVTGTKGVATTVGFELYGCVQVIVTLPNSKDGEVKQMWFDHKRLRALSSKTVMKQPSFAEVPLAEPGGDVNKPLR